MAHSVQVDNSEISEKFNVLRYALCPMHFALEYRMSKECILSVL